MTGPGTQNYQERDIQDVFFTAYVTFPCGIRSHVSQNDEIFHGDRLVSGLQGRYQRWLVTDRFVGSDLSAYFGAFRDYCPLLL
jgi:hypothetical protein